MAYYGLPLDNEFFESDSMVSCEEMRPVGDLIPIFKENSIDVLSLFQEFHDKEDENSRKISLTGLGILGVDIKTNPDWDKWVRKGYSLVDLDTNSNWDNWVSL